MRALTTGIVFMGLAAAPAQAATPELPVTQRLEDLSLIHI